MFKCLQNKAQPQHQYQSEPPPSPSSANIYQDECEVPYLAEAVDYSYNSYNHPHNPPSSLPPSSNHQSYYSSYNNNNINNNMLSESTKDFQLCLEGEDKDTFVLVPGLLGYDTIEIPLPGGKSHVVADYWSDVKEMVDDPLIVSPSPLGSSHDRAVEVYYQIKGGQVDYGLRHSHQFCHKQLGDVYEGLMPNWSPDNPIVLIGKGSGATTALHLQHLLSTNFFGQHTSGSMIKGVICLSAPHRGSTLPYYLGLEPGSKCIVHPFSILQLFLSLIHLICYFTCLEKIFNFRLNDQWGLSSKSEGGEQSLWSAITARSRFSYFGDNFLLDWSVEGARQRYAGDERDKHRLDSQCVYINYVTTGSSWKSKVTGHFWPRLTWKIFQNALISIFLGKYKFTTEEEQQVLRTPSSTFWQNNGNLPVYSQSPPPHQRVLMNISLDDQLYDPLKHEIQTGVWYNVYVEDLSKTVLFDDIPFFFTQDWVDSFIIRKVGQFFQFLSNYNDIFEHYYIIGIETLEKVYVTIKNKRLFLKGGMEIIDQTEKIYSPSSTISPPISPSSIPSSISISKSLTTQLPSSHSMAIAERVEKRQSDKSGSEWMHKIETAELFNSPSRMLYWMNQFQKMQTNMESSGRSVNESGEKEVGSTATSSFAAPFMQGPVFVRAKRKMTVEDYSATVMNGNASGITSSS